MHNGYPHYQHSIAIVLLKIMGVPAKVDMHQNSNQLYKKNLHVPTPPSQSKSTKYVKGGWVLTSEECMHEAHERRK